MTSLHPLFSQCNPAGRRSAMYGRKQIISVARSAQQTPHCEKTGRRTGGGCAVENAGASLPSSVLGASGGRSPSFSPGGHFWCHLLVSKGGKNCCSQETPNRRVRDASRSKNRFFLRKKCISAGRNPLKYDFKRFALRSKPEEPQPALRKQPCRTVKIRPQTDISD